jgi:TolB-like protein/Tfp pilus assembly protein PilF
MSERSFLAELKRRNVIRVAIAYVAVSWLVLQAGALIFQAMDVSNSVLRGLLAVLVVGFIPAMVFSWVYELTPEGLKRERDIDRDESITHLTGRRLDYLVIGVLVAVVALLLVDKFVLSPRQVARAAATAASTAPASPAPAQAASEPVPAQASIAVMPFVNMSEDKANEFFSDGISEELLNLLAKVRPLHVAARTSSFSFKGKEVPIPEIAKILHVAHVLEGSVRKSGNQVRITAQLIRAVDGYHLWSQTYDRKLDDIFAIQDEIAADVVKQLKVTLLGAAPTARQTDPKAYALYLQARQLGYQRTPDALRQSDSLYREVLAIDPQYAPAWAELARNLMNEASTGGISNDEGFRQAREAAEKALAIDPDYAPAYARLARVVASGGDVAGAAQHLERALALDPSDLDVLRECAVLLQTLGRLQQATAINEYVVGRDPVNVRSLYNLGLSYRYTGRYDEAVTRFRTVVSLNPGRGAVRYQLAIALMLKGDAAVGLPEVEQENDDFAKMIGLPTVYDALGRKPEADAALAALIAKYEKDAAFNIAYVYALRGDADKAFEWLDKAVQYADPGCRRSSPRTSSTRSTRTRAGSRSCAGSARRRSNSSRSSSR